MYLPFWGAGWLSITSQVSVCGGKVKASKGDFWKK